MAKRSRDSVKRWVMVDAQGRYSRDENGGQFSEDLGDAYVFVGRARSTEAARMLEVTLTVSRQAG